MADYHSEFTIVARRALAMWNREPASPAFGSFDRLYWGWLFKDFSDATLQYGARIAVEYAVRAGHAAALPEFLQGFVRFCARIQHRDGSFDQCYPYERTPGVIYDFLSTLLYVRSCGHLRAPAALAQLDEITTKAVRFCLATDEKHGEVANHLAEYSYELLNYARATGDSAARSRGMQYLERLLALFHRDEGWFIEYHGPDAGYQTRCLRYLTKIAGLTGDAALWDVAERAARFVEQLLMPDHSLHPMLGVRSTALLYPSGIEALAARDGAFAGLAARVRAGWASGAVPLPSSLDFSNAIRLADDALDAHDIAGRSRVVATPADGPSGDADFPAAGIAIRRTTDLAVYVAHGLGGPVVVYRKEADGAWRLAGEDAGYLLQGTAASWTTRMPGSGSLTESTGNRLRLTAGFRRVLHDELTPLRMVVLRLLNLTLLRSQWLGDLFRKVVVRRLMTRAAQAHLRLERQVEITGRVVRVTDRIVPQAPLPAREREAKLFRCRRLVGNHMASSRYFQPAELIATPLPWLAEIEWRGDGPVEHRVEYGAPRA